MIDVIILGMAAMGCLILVHSLLIIARSHVVFKARMAEMGAISEYVRNNKGVETKYIALDMIEEMDNYPDYRTMVESPRYYLKWTRKSLFPGMHNQTRNDLPKVNN